MIQDNINILPEIQKKIQEYNLYRLESTQESVLY